MPSNPERADGRRAIPAQTGRARHGGRWRQRGPGTLSDQRCHAHQPPHGQGLPQLPEPERGGRRVTAPRLPGNGKEGDAAARRVGEAGQRPPPQALGSVISCPSQWGLSRVPSGRLGDTGTQLAG